jgi:tRNA U34 2-thiouridine synthase MnmA/TrmU
VNARIYCDRPDVAAAVIVLDAPQYGIASGQAAVLYQGDAADILLGGGWISKAALATGMSHE